MKKLLALTLSLLCIISLFSCGSQKGEEELREEIKKELLEEMEEEKEEEENVSDITVSFNVPVYDTDGENTGEYESLFCYTIPTLSDTDLTVSDAVETALKKFDVNYEISSDGHNIKSIFDYEAYGEYDGKEAEVGYWECELNGESAYIDSDIGDKDKIVFTWVESSYKSGDIVTDSVDETDTYPSDGELYDDPIYVEMKVKDHGKIILELYPNLAPITVRNFVSLVSRGFYDGLTFHRVVKDFMIQGGDPTGTGTGGSNTTIKGEFDVNGVNNPLSHTRGIISMARSNEPDSASSQFFIIHEDSPHLDGQYAAFGKVVEGLSVVDSIASVEVEYSSYGELSSPAEEIVIEYIKVVEGSEAAQ